MQLSYITFLLTFLFTANLASAQLCTNDNRFTEEEYFSDNQIASRLNVKYATAVDWQGNIKVCRIVGKLEYF